VRQPSGALTGREFYHEQLIFFTKQPRKPALHLPYGNTLGAGLKGSNKWQFYNFNRAFPACCRHHEFFADIIGFAPHISEGNVCVESG